MKTKQIKQGNSYGTGPDGNLYVRICTEIDLTGMSAEVGIDGTDYQKDFETIPDNRRLAIAITAEESAAMPLGYHESWVRVYNGAGLNKVCKTDTIFLVRSAENADD